jgi:hypothetical protein
MDSQPLAPAQMQDDAAVRERVRTLIRELDLSGEALDRLFIAANLTADSQQTLAYRMWLHGQPPSPMIEPRRLLALLERRRVRRARGTEL